jgi:hypothetical protein
LAKSILAVWVGDQAHQPKRITFAYFATSFQLVGQISLGSALGGIPFPHHLSAQADNWPTGLPGRDFNPGRMTEPQIPPPFPLRIQGLRCILERYNLPPVRDNYGF